MNTNVKKEPMIAKKIAAALFLMAASLAASAQSATKDVVVNATLKGACLFDNATAVQFNPAYPAFAADEVKAAEEVTVRCTRGTTVPVIAFAGGNNGVVAGLVFELTAPWSQTAEGTAPAGTTLTDIGTARTGKFAVTATFPAGQAGTDGSATAVTKQMTITY